MKPRSNILRMCRNFRIRTMEVNVTQIDNKEQQRIYLIIYVTYAAIETNRPEAPTAQSLEGSNVI